MKQEALKYFNDTYLTSIGLMIFFLFFVGVMFWVYRSSSSSLYKKLELQPLRDEE